MFQVRTEAAPQQVWEVDYQPNGPITVNGQPFDWNMTALGNGRFHLLQAGRSFTAELVSVDYATKAVVLKLNGQRLELQAKDRFDLLLDKLGMSNATSQKVNELKAPMPGLIVDIRVAPGQTVQKGDPLLVLEAMKMENILKAPGDGTIAAIKVSLRDNVTKGQVLVQFS
ncbi:acetyl-CoA carboxylase biotin carboxyl carrier protein subunit [Hymenobacter metallilatus]|uniref:Biotin/lipoyl-binding protein n=1 Tax=Hymenobacter metallilatus TaxID=2493666 RepID=A0A3R9NK91_9BACT|nr:biotin/lipoyl-containing protein [Hymenobacter metallilatus]RSK35175.1 biotin/lipoyl-binding protein [Hymenobacter metallilatus]